MDDAKDERARLLTGKKFAVDRVRVQARGGGLVEREIVVHPGAVVVLPVRADGRVVMLRNHRFAVAETLWELPAGTLEPGEDPQLCAARELEEETGYTSARVEPLHQFFTTPGICTERIEVELLTPAQLDELLARGEIKDGKTLVTLLLWRSVTR